MNKETVQALAQQLLIALVDDGKVDKEEAINALNVVLSKSGAKLESTFYKVFIESDGDVHLILKAVLFDKLFGKG